MTDYKIGLMVCLFAAIAPVASANSLQMDPVNSGSSIERAATDPGQECTINIRYRLYLNGIRTGQMTRAEHWQGSTAVIETESKAKILGFRTDYTQRSELEWRAQSHQWISKRFHQFVSGFRNRDMYVDFSEQGHKSRVDIDGVIKHYHSPEFSMLDADTLEVQIRQRVEQGQTKFKLARQATDKVEIYRYTVKAPKNLTVMPWGELNVIPVVQKGADKATYYFAPSMNYRLVEARYHGFFLKGKAELASYQSRCN